MEVAVVSCSVDTAGTVSLWNPFNSTIVSSYYGGGICTNHGLVASNGYIIAAQKYKPMLHAWPLNKQHRLNKRLIAPGKITCLDVSSDMRYIAVGVQSRVHIYQTSSGLPCGSTSEHFQPVSIVRFSKDGSLVGSAGEDGLLVVHHLCFLVDKGTTNPVPYFTAHSHSLPITDFFFTGGGLQCRVVTCSVDLCVKMHDLGSKQLLYNGVFERQLTALALSPAEASFFVGDAGGTVHMVSLLEPPRELDTHYINSGNQFKIHEQSITALSCSLDTLHLLSSSMDGTVRLTHIPSRQTLQTIQMKGPVNNCFFYIPPHDMLSDSFNPPVLLHDFISNPSSVTCATFNLFSSVDIVPEDSEREYSVDFSRPPHESNDRSVVGSEEVSKLHKINTEMYHFAMNNLFKGAHKHQKTVNCEEENNETKSKKAPQKQKKPNLRKSKKKKK